jgi:hypothetical protein
MENKTYVSQVEVNKFLEFFKEKKIWNYYLIVYNLIHSEKPYKALKKSKLEDILVPEGIPHPTENPFSIDISGVSARLKIHQESAGIKGVNFSTRIFKKKFLMNGELYYGSLNQKRTKQIIQDEMYVYVLKHVHINSEISKILKDKKIGITSDIEKRMQQLTLGTVGVEIIKMWRTTSQMAKRLEKQLHIHFKERNLIGEWFSDEDESLVDSITKFIQQNVIVEVDINRVVTI